MRRALLLAGLTLGCSSAPTCDTGVCVETCSRLGVLPGGPVGELPPPQVLSALEVEKLGPLLADLRAGVQVTPHTWGVCRGEAPSCERFLGQPAEPLRGGPHHVALRYQLPRAARAGDWSVNVFEACAIPQVHGGVEVMVEERRRASAALEPGTREVHLLPFTAPADTPRTCAYRAFFQGPEGARHVLEGRYEVASRSLAGPAPSEGATPP